MRPSVDVGGETHYECTNCGARLVAAEGDRCDCGGDLLNLSRSRDL